ncbi:MAG: DUF4168 domain-containing protein [Wenzhouxiangella sp.]
MNMTRTLALLIIGFVFATAGALAQTDPMQEHSPADIDVSDQQLEQFVEAQVAIIEIQQDFSGRLQGVEDPEQAHELQVQANEEMTSAVADAGLDVESFNAIAMAIQNSPELQQRLTTLLEERS